MSADNTGEMRANGVQLDRNIQRGEIEILAAAARAKIKNMGEKGYLFGCSTRISLLCSESSIVAYVPQG